MVLSREHLPEEGVRRGLVPLSIPNSPNKCVCEEGGCLRHSFSGHPALSPPLFSLLQGLSLCANQLSVLHPR